MAKGKIKRALVNSGGGNRIPFIGAIAQKLINDKGYDYDIVIGASAGAMSATHCAMNDPDSLVNALLQISDKDIHTRMPIKYKKEGDLYPAKLHKINAAINLIKDKRTIGDSRALLNTIKRHYSPREHNILQHLKKDVIITVYNNELHTTEYKNITHCNYDDACDWIWGSTCVPLVMSVLDKDGYTYTDGGVRDSIGLEKAIELGADVIDVIALGTEYEKIFQDINNILGIAGATIEGMSRETWENDIEIGRLLAKEKDVELNIYYMPEKPTVNPLIFHPEVLKSMYEMGKKMSLEECLCHKIILKKGKLSQNISVNLY